MVGSKVHFKTNWLFYNIYNIYWNEVTFYASNWLKFYILMDVARRVDDPLIQLYVHFYILHVMFVPIHASDVTPKWRGKSWASYD